MPLSTDRRERLERLPDRLKPLLTLANVSNPTTVTFTYAFGLVMLVLQIGAEVRQTVTEARRDLDAEVKSAGLFRVPLAVDAETAQLRVFIGPGRSRYPKALAQLEDDVRVLDDPHHPERRRALAARLAIVATIGDMTDSPTGALGRLQAASLRFLDATLRSDVASTGMAEVPARAEVGLSPDAHALGAAAFGVLATDTYLRLEDACAETEDQDARSALLDGYVERLWLAGRHAVLADTLCVEYDSVLLLVSGGRCNPDQAGVVIVSSQGKRPGRGVRRVAEERNAIMMAMHVPIIG
jgi:hypothetical protein